MLKQHDRIFIHLDKTPERDGQTDRQKDRQNALSITAVCIASNTAALINNIFDIINRPSMP